MKLFGFVVFLGCIFYIEALTFDNAKSDILPSKEICGKQHCDSFPWLVFIPMESRVYNPGSNLRCAGALISKRYVITNKSCLQFVLTNVHIGQLHTTKNVTCANKPVLKIDVERKVVSDDYEVVLLRLAEDVEFGNDIVPICLPFEDFKRAEAGAEVYTSGWGLTSFEGKASDAMKEVKHTVTTNEECQKSGVIDNASDNKFMCVQKKENGFACNGDEGSPIMHSNAGHWVMEAILTHVFDIHGEPCSINRPARGFKITDEVLQWIVDNIEA